MFCSKKYLRASFIRFYLLLFYLAKAKLPTYVNFNKHVEKYQFKIIIFKRYPYNY